MDSRLRVRTWLWLCLGFRFCGRAALSRYPAGAPIELDHAQGFRHSANSAVYGSNAALPSRDGSNEVDRFPGPRRRNRQVHMLLILGFALENRA